MNRLAELMTNIDDKFIEQASEKRKISLVWVASIVATFCVPIALCIIFLNLEKYPIEKIYVNNDNNNTSSYCEVEDLKSWDELSTIEQYCSLDYNEQNYMTNGTMIEEVDENLGKIFVYGYDYWSEEEVRYEREVEIFSIDKISTECALAVLIDGDYYIYTNTSYKPDTLGSFLKDLNLLENVEFNKIYYDKEFDSTIVFEPPLKEKVFELFSDTSVKNAENFDLEVFNYKRIMGISVDVPIFGYKNISLEICEDGIITTNIFATGKAFCVGEDKTQAFIDYVFSELDGIKYVYVFEDGETETKETLKGETASSQVQNKIIE